MPQRVYVDEESVHGFIQVSVCGRQKFAGEITTQVRKYSWPVEASSAMRPRHSGSLPSIMRAVEAGSFPRLRTKWTRNDS
jgi:hypothetical protein